MEANQMIAKLNAVASTLGTRLTVCGVDNMKIIVGCVDYLKETTEEIRQDEANRKMQLEKELTENGQHSQSAE